MLDFYFFNKNFNVTFSLLCFQKRCQQKSLHICIKVLIFNSLYRSWLSVQFCGSLCVWPWKGCQQCSRRGRANHQCTEKDGRTALRQTSHHPFHLFLGTSSLVPHMGCSPGAHHDAWIREDRNHPWRVLQELSVPCLCESSAGFCDCSAYSGVPASAKTHGTIVQILFLLFLQHYEQLVSIRGTQICQLSHTGQIRFVDCSFFCLWCGDYC